MAGGVTTSTNIFSSLTSSAWNRSRKPVCAQAECCRSITRPCIAYNPPFQPIHRSCDPECSFHPCEGPTEGTGDAFFVDVAPPGLPFPWVVQHQQPDHPSNQRAISDPKSGEYDQVTDAPANADTLQFSIRDPVQYRIIHRAARPYYPACTTDAP